MDANRKRISERVIGCACEVSSELGDFSKAIAKTPWRTNSPETVWVTSAGKRAKCALDIRRGLRGGRVVIVELRGLAGLTREQDPRVMNDLRASGLNVGLLNNFGAPRLGIRRVVWQHDGNLI